MDETFYNDTEKTYIKELNVILQEENLVKSEEKLCILFSLADKKPRDILCGVLVEGEATRLL